eukprot:4905937-Karenia_brevis.AAC.1
MFEEFAAPVDENPAFRVMGEIEAALQEWVKVRNPSSRVTAHLEMHATHIQGHHGAVNDFERTCP